MVTEELLYFIAIYFPEDIRKKVTSFKLDFANRFQSISALKVDPHITIENPFKLPAHQRNDIIQWFRKQYINLSSFEIQLNNFGAFHNKYNPVVYIHPEPNLSLYSLQKEVTRSFWLSYPDKFDKSFESKFNPHVTVAYRDLHPDLFKLAWEEYRYKEYSAKFEVSGFHLLQHDRLKWNIIDTYSLRK